MVQSSNCDALIRPTGYDTPPLAQRLDIYLCLYNKQPLVNILIHINPVLKSRPSFLWHPLNLFHCHCAKIIRRVLCPWSILNKFVLEQSIHNMKGRTCNMHGDVCVTVIISGVSGGTSSNLGACTVSPEQEFSFFTLSSSSYTETVTLNYNRPRSWQPDTFLIQTYTTECSWNSAVKHSRTNKQHMAIRTITYPISPGSNIWFYN
jgi:hypothetical protein